METTLIFAQTVFYLTVSLAAIAIGIFSVIIMCQVIRLVREIKKISSNLNYASSEVAERIKNIIDRFSVWPILSFFLKKRSAAHESKGREK